MSADHILAIDQGTTSTRAIVFDRDSRPVAMVQKELPQHYPRDGWVEHEPEDIWQGTLSVCRGVLDRTPGGVEAIAAVGITNQRETVVAWDRNDGRPVAPAIVWQDRRTAGDCERLRADGHEAMVRERTGLLLDPYFSATKLAWILDHVEGARRLADAGRLAFGTIDCFLMWRLTGGRVHATDVTNAARTLLFDIHRLAWNPDLLELFGIPESVLPQVHDCTHHFGDCDAGLLGRALPIHGVAGDQQAATVGQACLGPGMIKSTYGTGCFALLHTGERPVGSRNRLLTTVAYRIGGRTCYAVEGAIFVAGASVKWLRDRLGVIADAAHTEALARQARPDHGVWLVPAFAGLGAPHWDARARGALLGLTLDTGVAEIARAALEAVCHQTRDLVDAMVDDGAHRPRALRVDGGMVVNDWLLQHLADVLDLPVERPQVTETTALGAAWLAGLGVGLHPSLEELASRWRCERAFAPLMGSTEREARRMGWRGAVARVRSAPRDG